ncbi:hypothetical protein SH661x_004139 [Planctomicrobium sp. SH661]|uniref:hypothetical protein n=1 Tax=Planctomicrobium sp. SH661 TaxID=3448124 RepID=UPI003F5B0246
MLRYSQILCSLALLFAGSSWATADETPLAYFGGDVSVLIRLKEPDQTMEKVIGLVNKVQPGAGEAIKSQQSDSLGRMISNPTLTGVDQSRDWYAGVYCEESAPPTVVFAIPALNAEDLVSALGEEVSSDVKDRWVLYTDAEELPEADEADSAATKLGSTGITTFTTGDLTVYVNIEQLSEVYAEQIELAQDRVLEFLNQLRFLPQQSGVNIQAVIDIYGTMAESFFQALEDGQTSLASVTITDTEIVFSKQVAFEGDSASANFLAKNETSDMPMLMKLPEGASLYYGFSGGVRDLTKFGLKMSLAMSDDAEAVEKLEEQLTELDNVEFGPGVAAIKVQGSKDGMLQMSSIFEAKPVDVVRKFMRSVVNLAGSMKTEMFQQTSTLQEDAETYGNFKGDIITVKQEFNEDADPSGIQEKIQTLMFGTEGMQSRTVYLEGEYATTFGGGEKAMKDLLKLVESSKSNAALEKYRANVMKEANLFTFLDLSGLAANALRAVSAVEEFGSPISSQMIDSLNLKTTYISMAVGSEENVLKSELRLPIDQIIGLTKLGVLVGSGARGGL